MDLYRLHDKPEELDHQDIAHHAVPKLIFDKYGEDEAEMKKHEKMLAREPSSAIAYAKTYLRGRFPEAEKNLVGNSNFAARYARDILQDRWIDVPEIDKAIARKAETTIANGEDAVMYAIDVIGGRFPEAEPHIAESAWNSWIYAAQALKERFKLGELALKSDPHGPALWERYKKRFHIEDDK